MHQKMRLLICLGLGFWLICNSSLTSWGMKNQVNQNCTTLKECDTIIGNLKDEMDRIEKEEKEKEEEKATLQSERFKLRDEVNQIQTNIIELKQRINELEIEIEKNESNRQVLENEVSVLREKINHIIVLDSKLQRKNIFLTFISESDNFINLLKNMRMYQHFANQSKDQMGELSLLVKEQTKVINQLESDKAEIVIKRQSLEADEAALVSKMEQIIVIEQQIQKELQKLQSMKMEASEVKSIMEEQKKAIIASTNDTFGIPLESGYVSCEFRCYVDSSGIPHNGIDLGNYGNTSTKVLASASGSVVRAGWHSAYGNHVMITHNINGVIYTTVYAHLHSTPLVSVGQAVAKGQVLGTMGNTGNSSGPHLHFELYKGYYNWPHSVNPRDYIAFPSRW